MRRPSFPISWLLVLTSLCVISCAPTPTQRQGWQRTDLWLAKPKPIFAPAGAERVPIWSRQIGYLGGEEVRDLGAVPPPGLDEFPQRRSTQVRVLEQRAGSRLAFPVDLAERAWVRFRPVGATEDGCPCTYRFGIKDARGGLHELWRMPVEEPRPFAAEEVLIDLSDFGSTSVELLFQIEAKESWRPIGKASWASPALYEWRDLETRQEASSRTPGSGSSPNILLIGLDTLRADHVGPRNRQPSLTPSLDRLAESSLVYTQAFSTFNATNPSFASILTGRYGKNHQVYDLKTALPDSHQTLAEQFQAAGYDTLAVIAASHLGPHRSGLGQGFDEVVLAPHTFAAELVTDLSADWMAIREKPFFAWLHYFDVHTPHTPPAPFHVGLGALDSWNFPAPQRWAPTRPTGERKWRQTSLAGHPDLYADEVAYLDQQLGRLFGSMEERGLFDNTLVAIVADHGENLGEHGVDCRHSGLWDTTTHVPLIVRPPGASANGRRYDGLVQTIDLFPTLLRTAGLEIPPNDGVDLSNLVQLPSGGRRAVFAELASGQALMVRTQSAKLIISEGGPSLPPGNYFYDLEADPLEERNLAGQGDPREAELEAALKRWQEDRLEGVEETTSQELDAEETEQLRSLGYLGG